MYEYKRYVYYVGSHVDPIEELNALGRDGWRVIGQRFDGSHMPYGAEIYTLEKEVRTAKHPSGFDVPSE